jgi:hypothetical protein
VKTYVKNIFFETNLELQKNRLSQLFSWVSEEASLYITGIALPTDGGFTAGWDNGG